jgi:transposase
MRVPEGFEQALAVKFGFILPHLNERQRRLLLGAEAGVLGHGGIRLVARAAGVGEAMVSRGVAEVEAGDLPQGRIRQPGAGRKRLVDADPGMRAALLALVEPDERGDPMSPLRWTTKSLRHLAVALTAQGHRISAVTVAELLHEEGFSLQGNAKVAEGKQHPDRDAQFRYINEQVKAFQAAGQPVISVDAKKKEIIGEFKNAGREWRPVGEPVRVDVHDFPDKLLGKAIPYGVYDVSANTGWVSVGTDHDTAAFAVESIRRWWNDQGRADYPRAARLLITADAGGSNGYRTRAFKTGLAGLAAETGLAITVCHMPPATSKWNAIEHRLFSAITMNWRGRPLTSHEVVVNSIAATTTATGLRVRAELDAGAYPTGIVVSDAALNAVPVTGHTFHSEWNYTIHPWPAEPDQDPAATSTCATAGTLFTLDRAALTHPGLTGLTYTGLSTLTTAMTAAWHNQRAPQGYTQVGAVRRRAPGGGRPQKMDLADRVLATVLHQRLTLPPSVLAHLFAVGKDTIRNATAEITQLMERHGHTPQPAITHLTTVAGLRIYAAEHRSAPTA